MKKILFIILILALLLLTGCRKQTEQTQKSMAVPAGFSTAAPDKAFANVVETSTETDCDKLPLEAQRQACKETLKK